MVIQFEAEGLEPAARPLGAAKVSGSEEVGVAGKAVDNWQEVFLPSQ
jgi:hypothetical protein